MRSRRQGFYSLTESDANTSHSQSTLCQIHGRSLFYFAKAFGVRTRPHVAFGSGPSSAVVISRLSRFFANCVVDRRTKLIRYRITKHKRKCRSENFSSFLVFGGRTPAHQRGNASGPEQGFQPCYSPSFLWPFFLILWKW